MLKTIALSIITIGAAFLLTPDYVNLMVEFTIELFSQWFWFI